MTEQVVKACETALAQIYQSQVPYTIRLMLCMLYDAHMKARPENGDLESFA